MKNNKNNNDVLKYGLEDLNFVKAIYELHLNELLSIEEESKTGLLIPHPNLPFSVDLKGNVFGSKGVRAPIQNQKTKYNYVSFHTKSIGTRLVPIHRVVTEAILGFSISSGINVHHQDSRRHNNAAKNLCPLSFQENSFLKRREQKELFKKRQEALKQAA